MQSKIDWSRKIEEYKQSKMSQKSWCKTQGIPPSTFFYHLHKNNNSHKKQFIELKAPSQGIKLHIGPAVLELAADFDEKTLKRFLKTVGCIC